MSMVSWIVNFVKKCKNADSQSLWYRWLKFLIFLIALLVIIDILDHETYIYQSTVLLDIVHPSTRQECRIKTLDNNKVFSNYKDVNANTIVETSKLPSQKKKLSIGIVYIYEKNKSDSTWDENIMSGVLKNRQIYCARHGYSLINGHDSLDTSRPAAWSKLLAAKNALYMNQLDYIVYMDMDIVILDLDIKIEDFIDAANPTKITSDFIMATDWSGPNTGVWIAKNTQFTKNFLQLLWDQDQLVPPRSPEGASYPFEYEQRAFHYLLNTDVWQNRYWLKVKLTINYSTFKLIY